jgi:preprotein translocase subunit SecE
MNIWTIALILIAASAVAAYMGYGLAGWCLLGAAALALFFYYRLGIFKFVGETKVELDKCAWPWDPNQTGFKKFRELRDSTVVVILSVILLAGFVTTSDWLLTHLVGFLTGTGIATAHAGAAVTTPPPVH